MKRHGLNISALRSRALPRIPVEPRTVADVVQRPDGFGFTRRQALGITGLLSLTAAPMAQAITTAFEATYRLVRRGQKIAFLVAGVERWVLDPKRFGGSPVIDCKETDTGIVIRLRGALFPGTDISADLDAYIGRGAAPDARFTLHAWQAELEAPFVPWLLDKEMARGHAGCATVLTSGEFAGQSPANADVTFRPMWAVGLRGASVVTVGALHLPSVRCTISLLDSTQRTMLAKSAHSRTLIRLHRDNAAWTVPLQVAGVEDWTLRTHHDAFDMLSYEVADDGRAAVVLEGSREGGVVFRARDTDADLPLRDVRYAWTRTEEGLHEAFVARYPETPVWMNVDGISLELGDRREIPPLEIVSRNGIIDRLHVAPGLLRYSIPVEGAVTEPVRMQHGMQVAFLTSAVSSKVLPAPAFHMAGLQIDFKQNVSTIKQIDGASLSKEAKKNYKVSKDLGRWGKVKFGLPNNPRVNVIRPEDLLVLTFEFVGLTINKSAGTFGGSGKLVVWFQPQHIAERAFFYTDPNANPKKKPNEGYPNSAPSGSDEPPLDPPIDAVMAQDSRLAFNVPNGYSGTYSIEGLLDWSKFTLNVSPSAKPPEVALTFGILNTSFLSKYALSTEAATKNVKPFKLARTKAKASQPPTASGGGSSAFKKYTLQAGAAAQLSERSDIKDRYEFDPDMATALSPQVMDELIAVVNQRPPIREPQADETSIEYPYRLMLSPNKYAGWAHAKTAKIDPDSRRAELWHTRLGVKHSDGSVDEHAAYFRTVRAIWSPDFGTFREMSAIYKERPFRTSLNRRDRHEIVQLTSDYAMKKTKPAPVQVNRMMLTSLGAWMDSTGAWDPMGEDNLEVESWVQRGAQGRDSFVRVAYKGFLFPFGNRATLIKETERKFRRTPRGDMAAYLMQRMFIMLREPVREFPADGLKGMSYQGRDFPFRRVRITTKVTPNLELPVQLSPQFSTNSFWPQFSHNGAIQDVAWSCVGTDWDNNEIQFSTPLVFLANPDATTDATRLNGWIDNQYVKAQNDKRRNIKMQGQSIALAPSSKLGDTSLLVNVFKLSGYASPTAPVNYPIFFPKMESSTVKLDKVAELVGADAERAIVYYQKYLDHAFEQGPTPAKGAPVNPADIKNPSQIFARLLYPLMMDFSAKSDKSGGLAAPSVNIGGLSRALGPIPGDLENIANTAAAVGNFDPMQFFEDLLKTKILGDITLKDVLDFVQNMLNNIDKMPGLDRKDDYGIKDDVNDIKSKADAIKTEAQKLASDVSQDVKDAKQALVDEVDKVKNEIQGYINGGKKVVEDRIKEWKKRVEDKVNELKSEIEKALKPLKDAGNEAYKKYTEVQDGLQQLKQGLQLVYEWSTEIKSSPGNILVPLNPGATDKDDQAILYLKASFTKKLDLNPPEILLYGSLSNFVINLIGDGAAQFLVIKFTRLAFSAKLGEKPDIDPDIQSVEFAGALSFVNKLKDLIPRGGSAGGVGFSFDFDVQPTGISASMTIGLPNVTVGVFSLQNMSFLMRLTIPFDGRSFSAYFAFCTKENPFRLTIMVFGGGGFFGIEITPTGVRMLEAAFEFGGNFAFDCGVASGGASVMAGIYYKMEQKEIDGKLVQQSELTGYFRLTGNLSILGIIRVSLLFELKLTWQSNGKVYGTATIEVEIEILFISFSVGVTVERQLKGSDGDPTFSDMLPQPAMWQEYCDCFA